MRVMIGFLVVIAMWTGVRPSESYEQRIFLVENMLFQKKNCILPVGDIDFFEVDPLEFQRVLLYPSGIFH